MTKSVNPEVAAAEAVRSLIRQERLDDALAFMDKHFEVYQDSSEFLFECLKLLQKTKNRMAQGFEIVQKLQNVENPPWSEPERLIYTSYFEYYAGEIEDALDGLVRVTDLEKVADGYVCLMICLHENHSFEAYEAFMEDGLLDDESSLSFSERYRLLAQFYQSWFQVLRDIDPDAAQAKIEFADGYIEQALSGCVGDEEYNKAHVLHLKIKQDMDAFKPDGQGPFVSNGVTSSFGDLVLEEKEGEDLQRDYMLNGSLKSDDFNVLNILGLACFNRGQYMHAAARFRRAYSLNPENPVLASNIVKSLIAQGHYKDALAFVDDVFDAHKEDAGFLYSYMVLLQRMEVRTAEGLEICRNLQNIDGLPWTPANRVASLSRFCFYENRNAESQRLIIDAIEIEDDPDFYKWLNACISEEGAFADHEQFMIRQLLDNCDSALSLSSRYLALAQFYKLWSEDLDETDSELASDKLDLAYSYVTKACDVAELHSLDGADLVRANSLLEEIEGPLIPDMLGGDDFGSPSAGVA